MKVNIKLSPEAVVPNKAHDSDAGFDLTAVSKELDEFGNLVYNTGVSIELPQGFVGLVFPRSSISKKSLDLSNSVGVVDPDYRGPIIVKFKPAPYFSSRDEESSYDYEVGERIAQLLILPFPKIQLNQVEELSETLRGEGGFGSTDNKNEKSEKQLS